LIRLGQNVQAERAERAGSLVDKYARQWNTVEDSTLHCCDRSVRIGGRSVRVKSRSAWVRGRSVKGTTVVTVTVSQLLVDMALLT
ncbi:hypothetical protein PtrEW7m1_012209, partial [Pyrenophora tritici-repentis]